MSNRTYESTQLAATKAAPFMATHARLLDRRRFQLLMGDAQREAVLAALDAYRNPDGGYGWGLEADLRSVESQPGAALHAFEVFDDIAPVPVPQAGRLLDWLAAVSLPDGGLPFAVPITDAAGCAPWWTGADPAVSSLQITAAVAAAAHRVAAHDPAVAAHPWLDQAAHFCHVSIKEIDEAPHALVLKFALEFLDSVYDTYPEAADLLDQLGDRLPADGLLHVEGGTEEEFMRPLDFAPYPGRPVRELFDPKIVSAELDRLAEQQQDDGGWAVDFAKISPAGALDWRGYQTVRALSILQRNEAL